MAEHRVVATVPVTVWDVAIECSAHGDQMDRLDVLPAHAYCPKCDEMVWVEETP